MGPRLATSRNERSRRHPLRDDSDALKKYRLVGVVGWETPPARLQHVSLVQMVSSMSDRR